MLIQIFLSLTLVFNLAVTFTKTDYLKTGLHRNLECPALKFR